MGVDLRFCANTTLRHSTALRPWMSPTFCLLMGREDVVAEVSELRQLGRLVSVNVDPLYAMNQFVNDRLDFEREFTTDPDELADWEKDAAAEYAVIQGNLPLVYQTTSALLERLASYPSPLNHLSPTVRDTLDQPTYFAPEPVRRPDGGQEDHFKSDLTHLLRLLKAAQQYGADTVHWSYG